jgi:trehalose synthase
VLRSLDDYVDIVGIEPIAAIFRKARKLYDKRICHINATFLGGGVAEILGRLVPLLNEAGLRAAWRTIHGSPAFFGVTKKFHNALQGGPLNLSKNKKDLYLCVNEEFSKFTDLDYDCVIVHDPQPLPLIRFCRKVQPWVWRCHIDVSSPSLELWRFLEKFLIRYDKVIFSSEKYLQDDLPVQQHVIHPAIDPLSLKNLDLPKQDIDKYIAKAGIPTDKPLVTQVSRMDPWKDPEGVLQVYERIRQQVDCRLLFCYNLATDDPEGMEIYTKIRTAAAPWIEKGDVLFVVGNDEILVNAVQRFSDVIIQKSIREGFGLTVAEAMWKGKPVVAGNVGGIPLQIEHGQSGFLVDPHDYDECANRVVTLLKDRELARAVGEKARQRVKDKFLITRLMLDYLDLIHEVMT